jgi:hypothetical protein
LGGNIADLQTGLAADTSSAIQGTPLRGNPAFDYAGMYGDAFNQASGAADLMDQALNQRQRAAPARNSVPSYIKPASRGPYNQDFGGYGTPQFGPPTIPNFRNLTPNFRNLI